MWLEELREGSNEDGRSGLKKLNSLARGDREIDKVKRTGSHKDGSNRANVGGVGGLRSMRDCLFSLPFSLDISRRDEGSENIFGGEVDERRTRRRFW